MRIWEVGNTWVDTARRWCYPTRKQSQSKHTPANRCFTLNGFGELWLVRGKALDYTVLYCRADHNTGATFFCRTGTFSPRRPTDASLLLGPTGEMLNSLFNWRLDCRYNAAKKEWMTQSVVIYLRSSLALSIAKVYTWLWQKSVKKMGRSAFQLIPSWAMRIEVWVQDKHSKLKNRCLRTCHVG